jgi:hypothetical protein
MLLPSLAEQDADQPIERFDRGIGELRLAGSSA